MIDITKSLVIVLFVSTVITSICYYFFNADLTGTFILTTIIQIAASWYINTYTSYRTKQSIITQQTELISQFETESTEVTCAYCGAVNLIPISPIENNDFVCTECGETNGVYVSITVAQKTVPIAAEPYEVTNYNTNIEKSSTDNKNDNE